MLIPVSIYDKVSIEGTYSIYKDIFINNLELDRKKDFSLDDKET